MTRKSLALLLVISLLFTSTTACTVCSDLFKTKPTKRTVTVQTLHVKTDEEGATGGYGNVRVTIETNPAKQLKVGVFEEEVAGAGAQWKSGAWMSAIIGSFLLGRDVSDYKFSYEVRGYIDGASASALLTSAVLAGLLGDEIKKDVTMTGTINPDGTIGPVGGIPHKLDGAKQAKKKKVLVPSGQRYDVDLNTEEPVDVISLGNKKGIEVKEVADIYEAYKELTGKDLPKAAGATTKKMELPSETYDKVKAKAKGWYSRYLEERAKYDQLILPFDTSALDAWVDQADELASKGDNYLRQGLVASAYNQITTAVLYTSIAYHAKKSLEGYVFYGGLTGAEAYLANVDPSPVKAEALLDELKAHKPSTLADTMVLADSYGALSLAWGLVELARKELRASAASEQEVLENIIVATAYYAAASYAVDVAEDSIDVGLGVGKAKPVEKEKVRRISEALRKASEANLDYFDNVVLKDIAESKGVSMGVIQAAFESYDLNYAFATSAAIGAQNLKEKLGKTEAGAIAVMGNSLTSFTLSSGLIAKYYSLSAETDDNGNVVGVANEKALINMLDLAEDSSLENINSAIKVGATPVMAELSFEGAKVLREGDFDNKFDALNEFWHATTEARLLTILAGMKLSRAGTEGESGFQLLGE